MIFELNAQNYKKEVLESDTPVVIKFYDHDCDVCKLLSPILDKVSAEYDSKARFANCNRLENSEIARKYGVVIASQIVVAYRDKKLGIFGGAKISSSGAHNAVKEEFIKDKINGCLEALVLK